jgi:hypothetical protein
MISKLIFYDNPVLKALIENPRSWPVLYDELIKRFGQEGIQPIVSIATFCEFFGFTKQNLIKPSEDMLRFNAIRNLEDAENKVEIIDKALEGYYEQTYDNIRKQLQDEQMRMVWGRLITKREQRVFGEGVELYRYLFTRFLDLFHNDYAEFVEELSRYLVWDYFCGISAEGISIEFLRQRQLGMWLQLYRDHNVLLPLGKVIDDLGRYFNLEFGKNVRFANDHDMVDAQAITDVFMGLKTNNIIEPINFLTFDDETVIRTRINLANAIIDWLNERLESESEKIPTMFGKVYFLSKDFIIYYSYNPSSPIILGSDDRTAIVVTHE